MEIDRDRSETKERSLVWSIALYGSERRTGVKKNVSIGKTENSVD